MQVLDAGRPVESQDLRIARSIIRSGRCMMLVVNKWDLVKGIRQEHYLKHLKERIPFIGFVPVVFVSVIQGRNLEAVMRTATELRHRAFKRVPTALLNQVIESACTRNLAPYVAGKRLKI
jgi:GTP-binding protein